MGTSEVLAVIERASVERSPAGITVGDLVIALRQAGTRTSETSVRSVVKELEAGGFIRKNGAEGRSTRWRAVPKWEEGGDDMARTRKAAAPAATAEPRRGKRPERTVEQDERVLALLRDSGPMSLGAVGEKLDLARNEAYASIWRLRTAGQVTKQRDGTRTPLWVVV